MVANQAIHLLFDGYCILQSQKPFQQLYQHGGHDLITLYTVSVKAS